MSSNTRELRSFSTGSNLFLGDPLIGIGREFNRIFDDLLKGSLWPLNAAAPAFSALAPLPQLDIEAREGELRVTAELPGVQPSDVDISLDGDVLKICGEKKSSDNREDGSFHVKERSMGRFERTVQLPFAPVAEQVEARFENGVLTLRLPQEQTQPTVRKIEIRGESASPQRAGSDASNANAGRPAEGAPTASGGSLNAGGSTGRGGGDSKGGSASSAAGSAPSAKNLSGSDTSRKQPQPA